MKVLIAEDEKNLAYALENILALEDMDCTIAQNGEDALEFLALHPYDIVLLDLMLPKKDGFEVLQTLQQQGNTTPVIVLTARTSTQDKVRALEMGARDYMTKPLETEELIARIHAHVSTAQNTATSGGADNLVFLDISLSLRTYTLTAHGQKTKLTPNEAYVLAELMRADTKVGVATLAETLQDSPSQAPNHARVQPYIDFLNRKLQHLQSHAIITATDAGYCMTENTGDPHA